MKILHLSSEESWRGGEQQMAYLIEEQQKFNVETHVAVRKDSEFLKWCKTKSIPFIELNFTNDFDFVSARLLKKYCLKNSFDLIHLHSSRGHGVAFLSALIGNSVPMVLSRRVDFPLKKDFLSRAKYDHSSVRKIICVSNKIKEIVSSSVKNPQRCITIYDGIDLNRFAGKGLRGVLRKEFNISPNAVVVGNVAALAPHKDYFTFLETAKAILENGISNIRFLIVGEGPQKDEIEKRIETLNLNEYVFMTGFRKDIENVFADLDILLYTSKEEGLGSTLLDAMAYGLPIVATTAGGILEIIIQERTGLTAPVQDAKKLSEQVLRFINDEGLRKSITTTATSFVKDFSKEKMAAKTMDVYREVL